jgi:hypothetical protein
VSAGAARQRKKPDLSAGAARQRAKAEELDDAAADAG